MSKVKIDKTTIRAVARLIAERFDPDDWPKRGNPIRRASAELLAKSLSYLLTSLSSRLIA